MATVEVLFRVAQCLIGPLVDVGQSADVLGHVHLLLDVGLQGLGFGHLVRDIGLIGVLGDAMCDCQGDGADLIQWWEDSAQGQILLLNLLGEALKWKKDQELSPCT